LTKSIYKNPTANITFNSEKTEAFPLRSGTRHRHVLSLLLFNTVLGILANAQTQEKEMKGIHIREENINLLCSQIT
jgi:hypothetical protein